MPWEICPKDERWRTLAVSNLILGETEAGRGVPIPVEWARVCAARIRGVRDHLRDAWVGLETRTEDGDLRGHLVDWVLACLIARENVLLLGPPGTAKTQIAQRTFECFGLKEPSEEDSAESLPNQPIAGDTKSFYDWWKDRRGIEREKQKYFRCTLNRFTQPEELFGPVEIGMLRQGILVRVNFGLMTGPGVRAAFLDEIFKGSGSILNALLTLSLERLYFNWGGMAKSDLAMLIGASNELPGGLGSGQFGMGGGGEDFATLHAFMDRFPLRLDVPLMSGTNVPNSMNSHLAMATRKAIERDARQFTTGRQFDTASQAAGAPSVNDLLLAGRCCLQQEIGGVVGLFDPDTLTKFYEAFLKTGILLRAGGSDPTNHVVTWSVSPRKLRALYKIALAHALVCDDGFAQDAVRVAGPGRKDLCVFDFIWDTPVSRNALSADVHACVDQYLRG